MTDDHLLAAVLDVLSEVDPSEVFGAAEVLRAVRPAVNPAPGLDEVDRVLELLALPVLGGVIATDGGYRTGAPADTVLSRLRGLAEAARNADSDYLDDRY